MTTEERIINKCNEVRDLLVQKNKAYGDSGWERIKTIEL